MGSKKTKLHGEKGALKLARTLLKLSKKEQQKVLSKLNINQKKSVRKKLHLLKRQKQIREDVERNIGRYASKEKYHKLSELHKKFVCEILRNKRKYKKREVDFIEVQSEELYQYFKDQNRKTGTPHGFFKGMDNITRHDIVSKADEKYDTYSKYLSLFVDKSLARDEEPPYPIPRWEERFFNEAREAVFEHPYKLSADDQRKLKMREERRRKQLKKLSVEKREKAVFENIKHMATVGDGDAKKGKKKWEGIMQRGFARLSEIGQPTYDLLKEAGWHFANAADPKFRVWDNLGRPDAVAARPQANETLQHIRNKNFVADMFKNSKMEWEGPKTKMFIDVMFKLHGKIFGIEIQEKDISADALNEKIRKLEHECDGWVIIVPKKKLHLYKDLKSDKGGFTTLKGFIDKFSTDEKSKKEGISPGQSPK